MYEQIEKPKENTGKAVANSVTQKRNDEKQGFGFVDNRARKKLSDDSNPQSIRHENVFNQFHSNLRSVQAPIQMKKGLFSAITEKKGSAVEKIPDENYNIGFGMDVEYTADKRVEDGTTLHQHAILTQWVKDEYELTNKKTGEKHTASSAWEREPYGNDGDACVWYETKQKTYWTDSPGWNGPRKLNKDWILNYYTVQFYWTVVNRQTNEMKMKTGAYELRARNDGENNIEYKTPLVFATVEE